MAYEKKLLIPLLAGGEPAL